MSIRLMPGNGRVIRSIALAVLTLRRFRSLRGIPPPVPSEQPKTFDVAEIKQVEPGVKASALHCHARPASLRREGLYPHAVDCGGLRS